MNSAQQSMKHHLQLNTRTITPVPQQRHLIEEIEAHISIFFLFGLRSSCSCSGSCSSSTACSGCSGDGKGARVFEEVLDFIGEGEGELCLHSDGQQVLVSIDEGMGGSSQRRDGQLAAQCSNVLDPGRDVIAQIFVGNVEHLGIVECTVVIDLLHHESVSERLDAELREESGFGSTDLLSDVDDVNISSDFDGTLVDLGRDIQDLEERSLRGIHTGTSSGNGDVVGGDETHTSRRADLEVGDGGANFVELALREDDTNVADEVIEENGPLVVAGAFAVEADAATEHGIFAHQDGGIVANGSADIHKLLGTDVIGMHKECPGVGIHEFAEFGVILQREE